MAPSSDITAFRKVLAGAKNVIILSGAGLSAPSGIATYRGSGDASLWSHPSIVKYSQSGTFTDDPSGSWQFYSYRRTLALAAKPNSGHLALAALNLQSVQNRVIPGSSDSPLHITQNLDDLSLRAIDALRRDDLLPESSIPAAKDHLIQVHGSLFGTRCLSCSHTKKTYDPFLASSLDPSISGVDPSSGLQNGYESNPIPVAKLPKCGGDAWAGSNRFGRCGGLLRPDVVWFGEVPPSMGEIARKMTWCDLLIVVGTSSIVAPASAFASQVKEHSGKVAVFNLDRSNHDDEADFLFLGSCDTTLPEVFDVKSITDDLLKSL